MLLPKLKPISGCCASMWSSNTHCFIEASILCFLAFIVYPEDPRRHARTVVAEPLHTFVTW